MESYRPKGTSVGPEKKLLVPISGGVSSALLLQILDSQVQRQLAGRGRAAYDLHVLLIDTSQLDGNLRASDTSDSLRQHFPSHTFSRCNLHEVFVDDKDIFPALKSLGFEGRPHEPERESLERLMASASTSTSRSELLQLLLTRLIVRHAKSLNCESVLWGHSDSRLAAKALSNVAKGRGSALPLEICDGMSPWGLHFQYPLRDLFKSELELYASLLPDELSGCSVPDPPPATNISIRNTSIDELLSNYITSQGEKYPSIMANVVRTSSKLQVHQSTTSDTQCILCSMPIAGNAVGCTDPELCYGCVKIKLDMKMV